MSHQHFFVDVPSLKGRVCSHRFRGEAGESPSHQWLFAAVRAVFETTGKPCVTLGRRINGRVRSFFLETMEILRQQSYFSTYMRMRCLTQRSRLVALVKLPRIAGFREQRPHHSRVGPRLGLLPDAGVLRRVVSERLQRQAGLRLAGQRGQGLGCLSASRGPVVAPDAPAFKVEVWGA